jgi:hypothetical protein
LAEVGQQPLGRLLQKVRLVVDRDHHREVGHGGRECIRTMPP